MLNLDLLFIYRLIKTLFNILWRVKETREFCSQPMREQRYCGYSQIKRSTNSAVKFKSAHCGKWDQSIRAMGIQQVPAWLTVQNKLQW